MIVGPILLPSKPAVKVDSPIMIDWGGQLTPPNGGAVQTLLRLGTRHAWEITLPPMPTEPTGRIWAAALRQAKLFGALLPWTQDGFRVGAPGAPVVDGAGQAGSVLNLRGFTPRYPVRYGQAFSLIVGGRRYLYFAAADLAVGADGKLQLPIFPMLRKFPADGDTAEFARPMIQGSLGGNQVKWTRQTAPWSDFGTLTITEDE